MEILKNMPARVKYPWDEWFDGRPRCAARGTDFELPPTRFRELLLTTAKRRGLKIQTHIAGDLVAFQTSAPE